MKYSILGFNQAEIIKYNIDLTDLLLLNYLIYAQANVNMKHILDDEKQPCVWLQHKHILEDLPILNITEGTLKNRFVKLKKMGLIDSITLANENTQGTRTYYKSTSLLNDMIFESTSLKNDVNEEARHLKMTSNKLVNNNKKSNKNNSKELLENFNFGKRKEPKQNLYSKCLADINSRDYNEKLKTALIDYLNVRLQIKDKPLYANSWKGLLNRLEREFDEKDRLQVVYQSIERGYASFFPVNKGFKKSDSQLDKPWEKGVTCRQMTADEKEEHEKWLEEMRAKGVKVDF